MKNLMAASLVLAAFMQHAYAAGQRYWIVTMPPTEYDVAYPGELTLWRFSDGDYPCGAGVAACALHRKGKGPHLECHIYIASDNVLKNRWGTDLAQVLQHELAHCNGWPTDHPGGKKVRAGTTKIKMAELNSTTRWLVLASPTQCLTPDRKVEPCNNREPATAPQTTTARQ